jgi:hypothetical protein
LITLQSPSGDTNRSSLVFLKIGNAQVKQVTEDEQQYKNHGQYRTDNQVSGRKFAQVKTGGTSSEENQSFVHSVSLPAKNRDG